MSPEIVLDVTPGAAAVPLSVLKIRDDAATEAPDHLAVEEPLEIRLGGMAFTVTMRTPGHDEDLVAGLLHAEGVIRSAESIDVIGHYRGPDGKPDAGNVINVILKADLHVARERLRRSLVSSSACGVCGKVSIEAIRTATAPLVSTATVAPALFPRIAATLAAAQPTFQRTGGLHAAALFDLEGRLLVLREDVGRHNAVDKVVGHMLRTGDFPLADCILMVSGRASFEIMQKAWSARIPVVAAVSAPSSMAVQLAQAAGMTLVGFLRGGGFNVYAGAHRVTTALLEPACELLCQRVDIDPGRRVDEPVADVQPVREEQRVALDERRRDRLGVHLALQGVRDQHHHQVGFLARLGGGEDAQAVALRLLPALRPGLQAHPDVHPRVPQRQRVRVPLAAVAEDGDVPLLDEREVGVVVVEDLCH